MRSGAILVALAGLSLLAAAPGAPAREPAPDAYPDPEVTYREPAQVWNEILALRDELALLTDEEELEKVAESAARFTPLRRELYAGVQIHLGIRTPEEERDPANLDARVAMIKSKRALGNLPYIAGDIAAAARSGIPGNVRKTLEDLDGYLAHIEQVLTEALGPVLTGDQPAAGS